MRDRKGVYRVLVGRPDGKRSLGRPRLRPEDIKMDLQEDGWGDWIYLARDMDRWWVLVNRVMNFRNHKMQGISRLAEDLLSSQERLCSMKLV
jgi:hypothetical protein